MDKITKTNLLSTYLAEWDPMGFIADGAQTDEYSLESEEIVKLFHPELSEKEIAKMIHRVFIEFVEINPRGFKKECSERAKDVRNLLIGKYTFTFIDSVINHKKAKSKNLKSDLFKKHLAVIISILEEHNLTHEVIEDEDITIINFKVVKLSSTFNVSICVSHQFGCAWVRLLTYDFVLREGRDAAALLNIVRAIARGDYSFKNNSAYVSLVNGVVVNEDMGYKAEQEIIS